jgi:hypothetical protein
MLMKTTFFDVHVNKTESVYCLKLQVGVTENHEEISKIIQQHCRNKKYIYTFCHMIMLTMLRSLFVLFDVLRLRGADAEA